MNKAGTAAQVIARPQGGGAIKGIGDTFSPDLHTGTGKLTVPIAVPPGRNGLQPDISLVYSTGHGNGPFGLGWALSVPGVTRDTRQGFPSYSDDEDTFLLSGAEQLVPAEAAPDGAMTYLPRTEGLFARITHRFTERDDYWEARSRDGLVSWYGQPGARGADTAVVRHPDHPARVFAWQLSATADTFGNRIEYLYEREPVAEDGPHRWDQIYLKTIRYVDYGPPDAPRFLVTVDFAYEARPDPFSIYRPGFEIRTTRRCVSIEVHTHADTTRLTRVHRLIYQDQLPPAPGPTNGVSLLCRIEVEGVDGDAREFLPPLDFGYSGFDPTCRVYQPLSAIGGAVPERSLAHPDFELADLFGRGLPDVVQVGDTSRYWRNLGGGRLDLPRPLDALPPGVRLGDRWTQLADLDGDGHIDLLVSQPALSGYVPLSAAHAETAPPFVSYRAAPSFPLDDPEVRLVDLDGDGVADALRTGASFELYFHDRALGWTRSESRARDELDRFPDVRFSDPRVKLADMSGDGSQDIVLVGTGSVDYWPYLGDGRWGRRIAMRGRLDFPDATAYGGLGFDPGRLLLGDVDGDGLADLVYIESGRVTIWLNQSGNGWSEALVIHGTPPVSQIDAVRLADMLGHGTDGILWSYDFRSVADSSYKYLDLTGGTKPYLLVKRDNNSGARTIVEYAPSTRYYLEDQPVPATRWCRRLPSPVQVVARVEAIDELSGGKFVTEYRYHQGYWDGEEREFRGFGMVERVDTETFARYHAEGLHGATAFAAVDPVHFSPPTLTRTWYHQGQVQDENGVWRESGLGTEVWPGDVGMLPVALRVGVAGIARAAALKADPLRLRHALRTLSGLVLRSELYALDGSARQERPYTVTESLYDVREIASGQSPPGPVRVFAPFQVASRTTQWERGDDPMTQFTFTGGYDEYGLPHTQLAVAVPRGRDPLASAGTAGEPYLAVYSVTEYARRDDAERYIVDRAARATAYELVNDGRPSVLSLRDAVAEGRGDLRLTGHSRSYYDGEAFVGLPLGHLGDWGVVVRTEELAFTDGFLDSTFDPADPRSVVPRPCYLRPGAPPAWTAEYPAEFRGMLPPLAGYLHYAGDDVPGSPGGYYIAAARHRYDVHDQGPGRGLPRVDRDELGSDTLVEYDQYGLLPVRVTDAVGLATLASYDYRVLSATRITDPNGNLVESRFSPAGFVVAQYLRGKNGTGDTDHPSLVLTYDLLAYAERRQPLSVRSVRRVHHDSEAGAPPEQRDAAIESVVFSDGFGRLLQSRTQAPDTLFGGPAPAGAGLPVEQGAAVTAAVGRTRQPTDPVNVVVSGWQRYDNKGRVVEKFEPFFAQGWDYADPEVAQLGQRVVMAYDPRGRLIRTINPDGSEQLVVFGVPDALADPFKGAPSAWEVYSYDANDNAGRTHPSDTAAYGDHWNTPGSILLDPLGRTVAAISRNGPDPAEDWYESRSSYDIQGRLLAFTDPLDRVAFRYTYDLAGRGWRVDGIDGGRRDSMPGPLGNPVERRDAKGALTLHGYDLLHRSIRVWARDGAAGAVSLRARLEYGDGGRPDQPEPERGAARTANLLGRLVRHHDEAGLATVVGADFKGNVLETSRRVIADAPILAGFASAPGDGWRIAPFQVDWQPSGGQSLAALEAALLEPTPYRRSASYDALDRVTRTRCPQDADGQRRTLRPEYNSAGGLERVFLDDELFVERIAYDAKGMRLLIAYGNGVMTRYAYDPHSFRLRRLRSERFVRTGASYQPRGDPLQDFGYAYDLAGNPLTIQDRTPAGGVPNNPQALSAGDPVLGQLLASGDAFIRHFGYDPSYRLRSATGRECDRPPDDAPWLDAVRCADLTRAREYRERYQYDRAGNLVELDHRHGTEGFTRVFVSDAASNRLRSLEVGQAVYDYAHDPSGNVVSETASRHFDWTHADQMRVFRTQAEGAEPSVYVHYLYDAAGQRVRKVMRTQGGDVRVTTYIEAIFEHERWSGGENSHIHVTDNRQRVAITRQGPTQSGSAAPAVQYHLADHLGSSHVVVDAAGGFVDREEATPYGETSFGRYARKRYRWLGLERDEESGLSYHGARYYSPWSARWRSADPAGLTGGANQYQYGLGNPMRLVDLDGQNPRKPVAAKPARSSKIENLQSIGNYRELCGPGRCFTDSEIYQPLESSEMEDRAYEEWTTTGHRQTLLQTRVPGVNDPLSDFQRRNVDEALVRVTQNNDVLLRAYYDYYRFANRPGGLQIETPDKGFGETDDGDTIIAPSVVNCDERSSETGNPLSLLGTTLLHEFVHTPHGPASANPIPKARQEAKAYGVEYFFANRVGDTVRAGVISNMYSGSGNPIDQNSGAGEIYNTSERTMEALYEVIDTGSSKWKALAGVSADQARAMTVEFMTKNTYGKTLSALVKEVKL